MKTNPDWDIQPWQCGHSDPIYRGPDCQECAICHECRYSWGETKGKMISRAAKALGKRSVQIDRDKPGARSWGAELVDKIRKILESTHTPAARARLYALQSAAWEWTCELAYGKKWTSVLEHKKGEWYEWTLLNGKPVICLPVDRDLPAPVQ